MNIFTTYASYGLSVIPVNGKIPQIPSWKQYQGEIVKPEISETWVNGGIAIICGKISGGLVCIDFDIKNGNKWLDWSMLIAKEYPELLSKLVIEKTPSGGYHVLFRSDIEIKNTKLAINLEKAATIETRGEGGYFVCAPSQGYEFYYSDFSHLQKLSDDETEIITLII